MRRSFLQVHVRNGISIAGPPGLDMAAGTHRRMHAWPSQPWTSVRPCMGMRPRINGCTDLPSRQLRMQLGVSSRTALVSPAVRRSPCSLNKQPATWTRSVCNSLAAKHFSTPPNALLPLPLFPGAGRCVLRNILAQTEGRPGTPAMRRMRSAPSCRQWKQNPYGKRRGSARKILFPGLLRALQWVSARGPSSKRARRHRKHVKLNAKKRTFVTFVHSRRFHAFVFGPADIFICPTDLCLCMNFTYVQGRILGRLVCSLLLGVQ